MSENFYAALERSFADNAARTALETPTGLYFTYADVHREIARCAALLHSGGLARGDRVVVQAEKSPQSLFLYLACLRAGAVYVPLNTAYQLAELAYFLADARPSLIVVGTAAETGVRELARQQALEARIFTLDADGTGSLWQTAQSRGANQHAADAEPDDVAVIIYTSGTTGRSKGAMLTHRNLLSNALALIDCWQFSREDVLLHALPIFHVHGLFVANHCALLSGARMLWHAKFDADAVLNDLPRATVMMGVPTFYTRLLAQHRFGRQTCESVRLFISGSAPLLLETFEQFHERTGHTILERYGMSEAGMIASNPLRGERRGGTVGFPLPGISVRIADASDEPLPADQIGAIQVRGENVFAGYWQNPQKTQEEFTADGWFRTGDIGVLSADGYLSIVGRAKDLIITGGYNVYPKEIELVLDAMPGVRESAVVGLPHPDFGEAVTAVVVLDGPHARLDEAAVLTHLKTQLANYKVPKRIHFVPDLPRNAMGKVQKNVLREQFAA